MNVADVKTDIKNNAIRPYYIFAGDELEVQRIYVNKIAEVLGYPVVRVNSISDVWPSIITPTLFDSPCVYVVRDDKDIMQSEELQTQLNNGFLNENVVIHLLSSVDKRTKWYKSNSDKIVLFERLSTDLLMKYVKKLTTLNNANCERLIAICESDYSRILLEIDKIKRFTWEIEEKAHNESREDVAFERLVADGVIHTPPKDAIFELVDAILTRQINKVYDLLRQCYEVGEANMVILSVLYNNARQVLQVQACSSGDICKATGLSEWQVKCAKAKCNHYTIDELLDILQFTQETQKGIITGQIDDSISVEQLLVNIL